jgi:hypothetical protein
MSFQACLDNIKVKKGKTLEMKATELVSWLRENYELGHRHSMAIREYFKS